MGRRTEVVCCHHDAVLVLDGEHTRASDDRLSVDSRSELKTQIQYPWEHVLSALDTVSEGVH